MQVTIKKVTTKDVETQYGPSKKYGILTEEHGDKWLTAFENKWNKEELEKMKEGDKMNITVTQKDGFFNFRTMNKTDLLEERVALLEKIVLKDSDSQATPAPTQDTEDDW